MSPKKFRFYKFLRQSYFAQAHFFLEEVLAECVLRVSINFFYVLDTLSGSALGTY